VTSGAVPEGVIRARAHLRDLKSAQVHVLFYLEMKVVRLSREGVRKWQEIF
jgi:hypothetical protein